MKRLAAISIGIALILSILIVLVVFKGNTAEKQTDNLVEKLTGTLYWASYGLPGNDAPESACIVAMDLPAFESRIVYEGPGYLVDNDMPEGTVAVVLNGDVWDLIWLHEDGSQETIAENVMRGNCLRILAYKKGIAYFVAADREAYEAYLAAEAALVVSNPWTDPWSVPLPYDENGILFTYAARDSQGNIMFYPEYPYTEGWPHYDYTQIRYRADDWVAVSDDGLIAYCAKRDADGGVYNNQNVYIATAQDPAVFVGEGDFRCGLTNIHFYMWGIIICFMRMMYTRKPHSLF